jgi:hypothetical protein
VPVAARDCLQLEPVPTYGPGSGEGIAHLFAAYDSKSGEVVPHTPSVILSAAGIDTLAALKVRQASTGKPIDYDAKYFVTMADGRRKVNPVAFACGHRVGRDLAASLGWSDDQINAISNTAPEHASCPGRSG